MSIYNKKIGFPCFFIIIVSRFSSSSALVNWIEFIHVNVRLVFICIFFPLYSDSSWDSERGRERQLEAIKSKEELGTSINTENDTDQNRSKWSIELKCSFSIFIVLFIGNEKRISNNNQLINVEFFALHSLRRRKNITYIREQQYDDLSS